MKQCQGLGRIPSKKEIDADPNLKSSSTVSRLFVKETGKSATDYFLEMGFELNKRQTFEDKVGFNYILSVLTKECERINRIPTYDEINNLGLPCGDTLRKIFYNNINESYVEHFERFGYKRSDRINRKMYYEDDFVIFKDTLLEYSIELGRVPTIDEINEYDSLPSVDHIRDLFARYSDVSYTEFLRNKGYSYKTNNISIYDKIDFEDISSKLLEICRKLNRIPTKEELIELNDFPSPEIIRKAFNLKGYRSYTDYLREHGYKVNKERNRPKYLNFDQLCEMWDEYFEINGEYPDSQICYVDTSLPTWTTVKDICGDKFVEFYEKYGRKTNLKTKTYDEYCELFKEISIKNGKPLTVYDLINNTHGLPTSRWFIEQCPDENVANYNEFLIYLGFKPYYHVPKEYAIEQIMKKISRTTTSN